MPPSKAHAAPRTGLGLSACGSVPRMPGAERLIWIKHPRQRKH